MEQANCVDCGKPLSDTVLAAGLTRCTPCSAQRLRAATPEATETQHYPIEPPKGRGPGGGLSAPWKWSVGLGIALPVIGWLNNGEFSAVGILALLVVILIWTAALRLIIFIGQLATRQR